MRWFWSKPNKSLDDCDTLVHDILLDERVSREELRTFSARKETELMDKALAKESDHWVESSVTITVPDGRPHTSECPAPTFTIPGLMHRSITEIVRSVWTSPEAASFQYVPFKQFWVNGTSGKEERVLGELYTSDAFLEAHNALQHQRPENGCTLERIVCAIMAFSDSTHLASFGDASLWPLYIYFGNQSKYVRVRPSSGSCHHTAYIPKLPDNFHDFYMSITGEGPPADVLTHCRRELMHNVLRLVFDDDFMEAYHHGIVLRCPDGQMRRIYPRIFTYSADYPEK